VGSKFFDWELKCSCRLVTRVSRDIKTLSHRKRTRIGNRVFGSTGATCSVSDDSNSTPLISKFPNTQFSRLFSQPIEREQHRGMSTMIAALAYGSRFAYSTPIVVHMEAPMRVPVGIGEYSHYTDN
jgi:hypothetical protein